VSERQPPPPDILRRFTPTPYVFEVWVDGRCVRIEADDLEVALAIRHACRVRRIGDEGSTLLWRMIRDDKAPEYAAELTVFATGGVKALMHRSGTLLIADREKREVFGFIGAGLKMPELTERLLPRLMCSTYVDCENLPFTNK
jgi:hypothetical protein